MRKIWQEDAISSLSSYKNLKEQYKEIKAHLPQNIRQLVLEKLSEDDNGKDNNKPQTIQTP